MRPTPGQRAVIAAIRALTSGGVPCFVMHGNRDFLLGAAVLRATRARGLLPDPLIVTLYGEPVLVMHGDALCTDDRAYQRLRATVRDADWQRRFLALSVAARRALAGAARTGSQAHTASMEDAITDVNAGKRRRRAARGRRIDSVARPHAPARHRILGGGRARLHAHRARRLACAGQRAALGCGRSRTALDASRRSGGNARMKAKLRDPGS